MSRAPRPLAFALLLVCFGITTGGLFERAAAIPQSTAYWAVDDVRAGMKGIGKTCVKGTKVESFDVEVLGVLRNTSPGRDMVLARLAGLNLDKTGVIQGMSGSPVYLEGKLLGAVAFAWPYGKEPIAGITPFVQMRDFVANYERRDLAEKGPSRKIGLARPIVLDGQEYRDVTVSEGFDDPAGSGDPRRAPAAADGLWMVPLRTPLVTSGMSPRSLAVMRGELNRLGMVPMQGGAVAPANIADSERNVALEPGGALVAAMITGDFDMSGIGTVTYIDGKRVYGWGHPFFGMGGCDFPLMTGYTHMIMSRSSISFKMGSPLRTVGVINADVSTCIAGWLDRTPDMLPLSATVLHDGDPAPKAYNVKVVRHRTLTPAFATMALVNSIDQEGDLPDEVTAHFKLKIDVEGRDPIQLDDLYSGPAFAGAKGPQAMYGQVSLILQLLLGNSFENVRIKGIEAATEIMPGRRTADIESVELESDVLAPGETLRATVVLRPYRGARQRVQMALPLPADLPDGPYTAMIGDDLNNARAEMRDNPHLASPQSVDALMQTIGLQASARRTNLALRVPIGGTGVTLQGKALPDLPPSMVQILGSSKKTGTQTMNSALVARAATGWVVTGADTARFQVLWNKKASW
jgi:SpoIVB peptidase S55